MFITFHLSISFVVDADLRSDACMGHLPGFGSHATVREFLGMFWKIAVWTQSATDDPGFVPPSTGHRILHQ